VLLNLIDIQFLSEKKILEYGTTQMRCVQPAEFLESRGWSTGVGCVYHSLPSAKKAIVFHRATMNSHTAHFLSYAREKGLVTIYDTDDLLFTEDANEHLKSLGNQMAGEFNSADSLSNRYREMMESCDVVLVSTNYLKEKAETFHSDVRLIKNGLAQWFSCKAEVINQISDAGEIEKLTIAYLSGSKYHDQDFSVAEDALIRILEEFPTTNLLLVGKLNFSDQFFEFGERFQHKPFIPYRKLWEIFQDIDINIAPLEIDMPFAQARSELKYMEAGIFGVPTVASPTTTYAGAIHDGQNGLLVKDSEWYGALRFLLTNEEKRLALGEAARTDVKKKYCHEVRSKEWDQLVADIILKYSNDSIKSTASQTIKYLQIVYELGKRMARIGKRKVFEGW
jgi:glycosyltransferase involved in cell wall biosynthesis